MRRSILDFVLIGFAAATLLSGCGRKGPLEPPPAAQVTQPNRIAAAPASSAAAGLLPGTSQAPKPPPVMDRYGHPIAPPGPKKHIFLDNLIE